MQISWPARCAPTRAPSFIEALRSAHRWLDELVTDPRHTLETLALREDKTERSIRMILSLAFLAPDWSRRQSKGDCHAVMVSNASLTFRWRGRTNGERSDSRRRRNERIRLLSLVHHRADSADRRRVGEARTLERRSKLGCGLRPKSSLRNENLRPETFGETHQE